MLTQYLQIIKIYSYQIVTLGGNNFKMSALLPVGGPDYVFVNSRKQASDFIVKKELKHFTRKSQNEKGRLIGIDRLAEHV